MCEEEEKRYHIIRKAPKIRLQQFKDEKRGSAKMAFDLTFYLLKLT